MSFRLKGRCFRKFLHTFIDGMVLKWLKSAQFDGSHGVVVDHNCKSNDWMVLECLKCTVIGPDGPENVRKHCIVVQDSWP